MTWLNIETTHQVKLYKLSRVLQKQKLISLTKIWKRHETNIHLTCKPDANTTTPSKQGALILLHLNILEAFMHKITDHQKFSFPQFLLLY